MKEIVLATRNKDKGREIGALLDGIGITLRTLAEFPDAPEVVEDGDTCEANAIKKAVSAARHTGLAAVADDTGLAVDALNGRPGVHAARYAGPHATYEDNWRKLLLELQGVPQTKRTARFVTVAAIAQPGGEKPQVVKGVLEGTIVERPSGTGGFGYDPVFFIPQAGKTLAELSLDEKNKISHRAQAFVKAKEIIRTL